MNKQILTGVKKLRAFCQMCGKEIWQEVSNKQIRDGLDQGENVCSDCEIKSWNRVIK